MKIDITEKPKKTKDDYEKVKHLILDLEEDKKNVRIRAHTTLRDIGGRPPVELINSSLDEALKDLYTLENIHAAKSV